MKTKMVSASVVLVVAIGAAAPATAQFKKILDETLKRARQVDELRWTDQEEHELGSGVSDRVRARYGVVQDEALHTYVTKVGLLLARQSGRPELAWRFIVLDTDGVNAFAAPGGFVHVTRGALGLVDSEAELAGVLAHEIVHVTERHTIHALQKGAGAAMAAEESGQSGRLMDVLTDRATELILAGFGRAEEIESDTKGVALASGAGYSPEGLSRFLERLTERNRASQEKQGLFASHPEMNERLAKMATARAGAELDGTVTLDTRYASHVNYEAPPLAEIAAVEEGSAGLAGASSESAEPSSEPKDEAAEPEGEAAEPKKKRGFGLRRLVMAGGEEQKSAEVVGSGGSRGVDRERSAKGGSNPALVAVRVSDADLEAFRTEGGLRGR